GAGQGIVSFSAAALGTEQVVITDVDSALPDLQKNVQLNGFSPSQVQVTALDWTNRTQALDYIWNALLVPTTATTTRTTPAEPGPEQRQGTENEEKTLQKQSRPRLDYILASDVIWVDYLIPALVETLSDLLQASRDRRDDSNMVDGNMDYTQKQHHQQQTSWSHESSSTVVLLAYQFRSTRSDKLLFDSIDRLGLQRKKLCLDVSSSSSVEDPDAVYLDPKFQRPNLAIWKIWKD
ncbi:hypothetical protein BX616_008719, partial [Lobosporangium transversale]